MPNVRNLATRELRAAKDWWFRRAPGRISPVSLSEKAVGSAQRTSLTPPAAIGQWAVATYGREDAEHVLHLGNNDAHYVYLSQDSTDVAATPERHSNDPSGGYWSEERQRKVKRLVSEPASSDLN